MTTRTDKVAEGRKKINFFFSYFFPTSFKVINIRSTTTGSRIKWENKKNYLSKWQICQIHQGYWITLYLRIYSLKKKLPNIERRAHSKIQFKETFPLDLNFTFSDN